MSGGKEGRVIKGGREIYVVTIAQDDTGFRYKYEEGNNGGKELHKGINGIDRNIIYCIKEMK